MSARAMLIRGGIFGSASDAYHAASTISDSSTTMSPETHFAVKPIISECGNGHD
jgi:hypothetical protein